MVVYVAVIAVLNLVLGYWLAVYLGAGQRRSRRSARDKTYYSDDYEGEEYEADDSYDVADEEDEYEAAVS